MAGLIEILISFIGVILILALVSQSLIEVVKASFPIEAFTRKGSAKSLILAAAEATELGEEDGEAIYQNIAKRLKKLGQDGMVGVRLDTLTPTQLEGLITSVDDGKVNGLQGCKDPEDKLRKVADRCLEWYELSMDPVSERYRRRMRVTNLLAASVLVIALNVNAFDLMERVRTDAAFRAGLLVQVSALDTLLVRADSVEQALQEGLAATGEPPATTPTPAVADSLRAQLDSARATVVRLASQSTDLLAMGGSRAWRDAEWWLGILLTVLLVSLGAPFWHDILSSLFGLQRLTRTRADEEQEARGRQVGQNDGGQPDTRSRGAEEGAGARNDAGGNGGDGDTGRQRPAS